MMFRCKRRFCQTNVEFLGQHLNIKMIGLILLWISLFFKVNNYAEDNGGTIQEMIGRFKVKRLHRNCVYKIH